MASIGNQKEALLRQIEGLRNKVTVAQIVQLLERYDDLSVEDFKGRIPAELYAQLQNPQEARAWGAITAAATGTEQELRDQIARIAEFIKEYPESEHAQEAKAMKESLETDLVSTKIYEELKSSNPASQKEIGQLIQRVDAFIAKYPGFSKIQDAKALKKELESRIDNSLWQREWAEITAINPADKQQCESLLVRVNEFIDNFPVSPKLDDAISLKASLESKIISLDGEDKAIDREWNALSQEHPTSVDQYQSLISRIAGFMAAHPGWNKMAEVKSLSDSLKSQLDALQQQQQLDAQRREEEARKHAEEKQWMDRWNTINAMPLETADNKKAVISALTDFVKTYAASPKVPEAKSLIDRLQKELKNKPKPEDNTTSQPTPSKGKYVLIAALVVLAALAVVWFTMRSGDKGNQESVISDDSEQVDSIVVDEIEEKIDQPTIEERRETRDNEETTDRPRSDTPKDKADKKVTPEPTPSPAIPDWVKKMENINRKVKGGEITKIDFTPDKYDPKGVTITVYYPNFSVNTLTAADREAVWNLNKEIIRQYRGSIPVDIKVIALDVNRNTIN